MDAIDAILSRRSIRKYTDKPISEEMVEKLLRAGMSAPSAGNQQAWQFMVVNQRELLDAVCTVHPYAEAIKQATVAIIVCGDIALEKHKDYWVQDCSAVTQNILITAHALGLGAVWLGVYPRMDRVDGVKNLFSLPESVIPLSIIPVGYPKEEKAAAERYNKKKIHYNCW